MEIHRISQLREQLKQMRRDAMVAAYREAGCKKYAIKFMRPNAGPAGAPRRAEHAHSAIEIVTEQWGRDIQLRAYIAFTSSITGVASAYNTHNIHAIYRNTKPILALPYL